MKEIVKPPAEKGIILHPDNPFKEDVMRMLSQTKSSTRTVATDSGIASEKITMTIERTYLPKGYTKIHKNDELLDLSPWACKIMMYIALNMEYEAQDIKLTFELVGMNSRTFSKAMLELIMARVLIKRDRRATYWVNITMIITGRISKQED